MYNIKNHLDEINVFFRETIENEKLKIEISDHKVTLFNDTYRIEITSERYYSVLVMLVKGFVGAESEMVNVYPLYENETKRALAKVNEISCITDSMRKNILHSAECLAILFKEYAK